MLHKNRIYVAIGQDPMHGRGKGMLHCIDAAKTGDITKSGRIWTYDRLDRTMATVSIAGGLLYISDVAGQLHCLDAESGKLHWVYETGAETWGGALLADGKAYLATKKYLHVFAQGTKIKLLGKIRLGSAIYSTPVAANGVLYVASQRELWAAALKP
ncbi:MAG: PQQ-binding-like beta-propeller repeat protein [Phycisphaerae bacterium]|nr:PQQ-binding-like beta-propeller repeat protein [Phycisphaerae bacterium]